MSLQLYCPVCDADIDMPSASDDGKVFEGELVSCQACKAELVVRVHEYEDPDENVAYLKEVAS